MNSTADNVTALASAVAANLRENRDDIAKRWLDRIVERVDLDKRNIFPTDDFLDHIPLLIVGLADFLEHPERDIIGNEEYVGKAMELGELRVAQGFEATEVLREYDDLKQILYQEYTSTLDRLAESVSAPASVLSYHRLFRGLAIVERITASRFLTLTEHKVKENEKVLRSFNRAVSHELKNRIGVIQNAWAMLQDEELGANRENRERFQSMLTTNIGGLKKVVDDLILLSRTSGRTGPQRQVRLATAVEEVFDLFRGLAGLQGVELLVAGTLPEARVPAPLVELCLANLVSNGIKYSDPKKDRQFVEVDGALSEGNDLVIEVRDNGVGIPEEFRDRVFERFSRLEGETHAVDGMGLGLSIVRETAESFGGRAWVDHHGDGTTFFLAVPLIPTAQPSEAGELVDAGVPPGG